MPVWLSSVTGNTAVKSLQLSRVVNITCCSLFLCVHYSYLISFSVINNDTKCHTHYTFNVYMYNKFTSAFLSLSGKWASFS